MNLKNCLKRAALTVVALSLVLTFAGLAAAQEAQKIDACTLLTKAEVQAALGQEVGDGKLNEKANPLVGQPCEYKVGGYGAFSILVKTAAPGETADNVAAALKKNKIAVSEAGPVGDKSFFSSPGYGMIQLNTFKYDKYLIITMLVPGMAEAAQKTAAESLMRKALEKI
jgi:hypothetical protein